MFHNSYSSFTGVWKQEKGNIQTTWQFQVRSKEQEVRAGVRSPGHVRRGGSEWQLFRPVR